MFSGDGATKHTYALVHTWAKRENVKQQQTIQAPFMALEKMERKCNIQATEETTYPEKPSLLNISRNISRLPDKPTSNI